MGLKLVKIDYEQGHGVMQMSKSTTTRLWALEPRVGAARSLSVNTKMIYVPSKLCDLVSAVISRQYGILLEVCWNKETSNRASFTVN